MSTLLADIARPFLNLFSSTSSPSFVSSYQSGRPMSMGVNYESYVAAVAGSPTLLTALNLIGQSAAEPRIVGKRWRRASPRYAADLTLNSILGLDHELARVYLSNRTRHAGFQAQRRNEYLVRNGFVQELPTHPLVKLLNNPNPFQTLSDLMKLLVWDLHLAGDWFLYKARDPELGNVGELWRLRPDRVQIVPDRENFIAAYAYTIDGKTVFFPEEDVIHGSSPNPMNDYRGMSIMPAVMPLSRVESAMATFLDDFYNGGGNTGPGAIFTTKGALSEDAKAEVRAKLGNLFGRRGGMRQTLILTANESTFTRLGLERGLTDALPKEVNALIESHQAMPFGIPGSILGTLIGYESSSYANKRSDWQTMWDIKMTPLMSDFDDKFTKSLCPDFSGIDEVCFDLSDIRALQEDQDAMHERVRKDVAASLQSWEEGRSELGLDPDITEGIFMVPTNYATVRVGDLGEPPEPPEPMAPTAAPEAPEPPEDATTDMLGLGSQMAIALGRTALQIEAPRRGRPSLANDAQARSLWEKGNRLRGEFPIMTAAQVASRIGVSLATWKRYRAVFE